MERSDFNEALEDRVNLSSYTKEEVDAVAKKYPYATLLQLLNFQRKGDNTIADKKKLLLHFDNPLHLSVVTSKYSIQNEEVESKEELVVEVLKEEKAAVVSEPKVEEQQEPEEVEEKIISEHPKEGPKAQIEDVEEKETVVSTSGEKADVLELISELPEESPIKRAEESVEEKVKEENAAAQDPGDLMVMMSFTDWLTHFKTVSENEAEEKKGKDAIRSAWQKEKLAEAMDDEEDVVPDDIFEKAMKSVSFGDGLVTEPLAELYVQQGKTEKAIELYRKLSLLNPEKRSYFASRIKDLHLLK